MIKTAQLFCLAASLTAAPAFAQIARDKAPAPAPTPAAQASSPTLAPAQKAPGLNIGLGFSKGGTEKTLLPVGPIQKDSFELSWQPASKWGLTLDLTSRAPNELFAREEVTAGVTYQVTPRFRFGGGVTVKGDSLVQSLSNPVQTFSSAKDGSEASVRIESAFSF